MNASPLQHIEFTLAEMNSSYNQGRGRLEILTEQLTEKQTRLNEICTDVDIWHQVQLLLTKTSDYAREQLKERIESVVSAALQAIVTDQDLRFRVVIDTRAGQPTAEWEIVTDYDGDTLAGPVEDGSGGGIADIVSTALRLALLELARPKPGGPIIQDEPGKMISRDYSPNMAAFLKDYAKSTGRQILLVTHNDDLADVADRSYRFSKNTDESEVAAL